MSANAWHPRRSARDRAGRLLLGWILFLAGFLGVPMFFIGWGFSNPGQQRLTAIVLMLVSVAAMLAGIALWRSANSPQRPPRRAGDDASNLASEDSRR